MVREKRKIEDIVWQVRPPVSRDPAKPVILLLHGWSGDEEAMWVFSSKMPQQAWLLAPRGIYPAPNEGYGWHPPLKGSSPWIDDFQPAMDALLPLLSQDYFPGADFNNLWLAGFSQGAALAYAIGLSHPQRVTGIAGLAGFLPRGASALARNRPLAGKLVYVTHGTRDQLVPVERAREVVEILRLAGAKVVYCEDDAGHKLSAACFNGLEDFFRAVNGDDLLSLMP